MANKSSIHYFVSREGYLRVVTLKHGTAFLPFETARTIKRAEKWARKMGKGAEITRVVRRNGKTKIKSWITK